jgi:signal transduction histidine kinase
VSRTSTAGRIEVTAERSNGQLILSVLDDGAGFGGANAQPGSGTGLSNTRERLRQLYGDAAALDIVRSNSHTIARIRMPARAG